MMSIISAAFLQSVALMPQSAQLSRPAVAPRASFCTMQQDELRTFLLTKAQVSEKFIDRVVAICDDEMIGSAHDLEVARDAGLLPDFRDVLDPFPALRMFHLVSLYSSRACWRPPPPPS